MRRWLPALVGALAGVVIALAVGLTAVVLAPENGFADLAAATVTRVLLVPAGAIVGGVAGYVRSRDSRAG